jgi:NAD(P)-dependent dehydrogenase (short-subunit alcohol dehydrogenase family)
MIEQGGGGRIVNVSSNSAFRARMSTLACGSSKAALVELTRSLAAEVSVHGINLNAVAPGITRTPITAMDDDRIAQLAAGD